ncbi:MAG: FAD:protein FMN transferase [Eubacteriales bacterium]|nr:FAD:protein FMN transferase [Eubacteriales bacterium]
MFEKNRERYVVRTVLTKLLSAFLLFSVVAPIAVLLSSCSEKRNEFSVFAFDTYLEFNLRSLGKDKDDKIQKKVKSEVERYEKIFSRTDEGSELYGINQSQDTVFAVSDDLADLISESIAIAEKTGGAFDFTCGALTELWRISDPNAPIPDGEEISNALEYVGYKKVTLDGHMLKRPVGVIMDFGAIAKGYAEKKITELLISEEVEQGILSFGGNISVFGKKDDGSEYRVAIKNPYGESGYSGYVQIPSGYVSVCGTYERNKTVDGVFYHHIFDPESGYPKNGDIVSVALICDDGTIADAFSTALFVMGDGAYEWVSDCGYDIGAIFFMKDGTAKTVGDINYMRK